LKILWFIPTDCDERYLGAAQGRRAASPEYLCQLARAIDSLGYYGALLPTGTGCEEAWITASTLVSVTSRMRFLIAVRPGVMPPAQAARMAATFDRLSNGRLLINVVTGSGK
jgi:alkanesulfonate monooxygenase